MGSGARDRSETRRQRVTVPEAADILGLTVEAIRGRIKRGKLEHVKEEGTVYVFVDADQTRPDTTSQQPDAGQTIDQSELLEALRDQVSYLREQLNEERRARTEERRRQDTVIAQLMQRIPPQIEAGAPPEPRESPVSSGPTDTPTEAGREAHAPSEGQEEGLEERQALPWWRRWFGG